MRFAAAFGVTRLPEDDWFDAHLTVDTKLFVDPLLLSLETEGEWVGAHGELIDHFAHCFGLVARATSPTSVSGTAVRRLLTFPEPGEFCLGYTAVGTRGSGSGRQYASTIADGIAVSIAAGLDHPAHIEEVGILNVGIGADRISDAVLNVLKHRFVCYTQAVAERHSIPLETHRLRHASCHLNVGRWLDENVLLPTNPRTKGPVLLCPERFLARLPELNAHNWFYDQQNEDLRQQVNIEVGQRVRKEEIVEVARRHPDRVRQWANEQTTRPDLFGYDFGSDPAGLVQWDGPTTEFATGNPITELTAVDSVDDLRRLVDLMLRRFKHFIEQQRGWSLLWAGDDEKPEEAAQLLFLGMAQNYLRHFEVELDREVELGRGPVDFKLSSGSSVRMVIEIKKAHNGKFWNGLDHQLPSYMHSDRCDDGWFVAIRYRSTKGSLLRMRELPARVRSAAQREGKRIDYTAIDARRPASASNIRE